MPCPSMLISDPATFASAKWSGRKPGFRAALLFDPDSGLVTVLMRFAPGARP